MTVGDALKEYETLTGTVFSHPRIFSMRGPVYWPIAKYSPDRLKEAIRSVVKRQANAKPALRNLSSSWERPSGDETFNLEPSMCKT